ncbi:hypothetical protein E2562_006526 [Oryza meyeriana var. granulata]|uniref:Uncharacterized protein n=1 Tax=Oryza meyeriana var. granulata TaxID=110450 RepID=A0A6G1BTT1_9ORYZ|nr:hypothetical protein E2562_006526 [Oryza meyeriana var. granulata]
MGLPHRHAGGRQWGGLSPANGIVGLWRWKQSATEVRERGGNSFLHLCDDKRRWKTADSED